MTCLTATTPCGVSENFLSRMRQPWLQAFSRKRSMCMCLSLHRGSRKASDRRGLVYDRMEAGFHWLHTSLREAKTDSKLLQTGPRELQQGFISAQKSCTPTQVQCTVASYQSTANGPRQPTTSSQWSLYQPMVFIPATPSPVATRSMLKAAVLAIPAAVAGIIETADLLFFVKVFAVCPRMALPLAEVNARSCRSLDTLLLFLLQLLCLPLAFLLLHFSTKLFLLPLNLLRSQLQLRWDFE